MRRLVLPLLFVLLGALGLRAQEAAPAQLSAREVRDAVRTVVNAQLDALQQNRVEDAYAFAARGIRRQFPAPVFAAMIRRGYPALVAHARRDLGVVRDDRAGRAFVDVTVFDAKGRAARFRYQLVLERDAWRVEGVLPLRPAPRGDT